MRYSQTVRTWATRATRSNTRIELNPRLSNYTQLVLDGGRQSIRCLSVQTPCSRVKSCVGKSICCSEYTGTQFYSLLRRSLHTQAKRSCEGGAPMCEFRGTTVHAHTLRIVKASIRTAVPRLHAHSTPTPNATAQGKATVEEIMSVDTPLERFNLTDTLTVKRRVTKRRKMLAQKGSGITETNLRSRDINGDNMPLQAGKTVEELGSSPSEVEYILQKPKSKRGAATPTTTEQTQSATIQALESKELESGLIATEELKKDTVRTTELKKQWDSFRAQYPGHLLLYQCGDFYEIYDEDADLVETLTNLKVTEKNSTGFKRMAGFPLRVVHDWVARLLQCGVGKIAVVEQVQPPTDSTNRSDVEGEKRAPHGLAGGVIEGSFGAKTKILPRQVVRVYTPGTLYDTNEAGGRHLVSLAVIGSDSGQSPHNHENGDATYTHQGVSNSYGSARHGGDFNINGDGEVKFGVCYVDLETSELHVSSSADVDHLDEVLSRLNVAEVLLTQEASEYIGRHYPSLATRESVCHTVLEKTWFADTRATVFDAFAALHRGVRAEVEEGKADAPVLKEGIPIESEENASEKVPKVGGSVRELLGMSGARAVSDTTSTQAQSHAHAHAHSQTGAHPSARDTRDSAALDRRHVNDMELMAMSALLRYIAHTHPGDKPRLQWPSRHTVSHHMVMDSDTRKALELVTSNALLQCDDGFAKHTNRLSTGVGSGTLYSVLNRCKTYGGRRLLRARIVSPSTDVGIINQYLSSVAVLKGLPNTNNRLRRIMKECTDMERTLQHINIRKVDWPALRALASTMSLCAKLSDTILAGNKADDTRPNFADLGQLLTHVGGLVEASNALSKSPEWQNLDRSDPDFFVKNSIMGVPQGYDAELDNLNERISDLEVRHMDRIRLEMFGPSSRVKIVRHQRQGWILEISKRHMTEEKECIDGLVASEEALRELEGTSQIKRFSSRRLDALDTEFRSLERELADRQKRIFVRLCDVACDHTHSIIQSARALSSLDVASSLAVVADEHGFCRPEVTTGTEFEVVGGYHAAVQKANLRHHASFVANDCHLSQQKMWLITGPNMGGKSTFLRQNALMIIMAQAGSFVPARSATIGVCDQLFARVGASDDISRHMSTFMVEMMETARILQKATHRSFVVLDEIGRGTSTYDGMAIASAVFEHLHDHTACRTLAATHYKEVARVAGQLRNAACHRTVFSHDGGDIVYGYNLEPGVAKRSHGIDVARISGMPKCVTDRAHHLLVALEATGDDLESSLGNTIAKSKK